LNFLEACRKLIAFETTPQHGNLEAVEFLAQVSREFGFHVEQQHEASEGIAQSNLIVRPNAKMPPHEFLLQTHLDTVDPGNFGKWTKTQSNPFQVSIYGDEIYGLGVADTKLDFLCKLYAAKEYLKRPMALPFVVVGTYGAQTGMSGAIKLVRRKTVNAKMALIGEPTNLQLIHAGQGLVVVEITIPFSSEEIAYRNRHDLMESATSQSQIFHGVAAHSSRPEMGQNAIVKMLDALVQLPQGIAVMGLDGGVNFNSVPDFAVLEIDLVAGFKDPIVPKIARILKAAKSLENDFRAFPSTEDESPSMNIGTIRTYDDQVRVIGSCRMPHAVPETLYQKWMTDLGNACESKGAAFRIRDYKKAFHVRKSSQFLKGCSEVLESLEFSGAPKTISVATEASVFSRMGLECLVFGPGTSVGNSHAPNEKIKLSDLNTATQFYSRVIERFCL
jgi:acetylornithine deacetylase/succinyl-diaminopimelate desuccinylase-like protein